MPRTSPLLGVVIKCARLDRMARAEVPVTVTVDPRQIAEVAALVTAAEDVMAKCWCVDDMEALAAALVPFTGAPS